MLTLENLTIELMGERIVERFNFQLNAGKVSCLFGPSGCGKTTILRAIANIIELESGRIENQFSRTAYLFQEHRLLPWRTAWENITLVEKNASESNIGDLLTHLALDTSDWHKYPHELSGGMRQRVALARALIIEPDLLLMDEPFSALDFELKQSLQQLIMHRVKHNGMSIILVTHDRYEALKMSDAIYLLAKRKPTFCQREIVLSEPYLTRNADFVERHLTPEFWSIA